MKSGYNILWTDYALEELEQTIDYLERNFTEKEISKLAKKIESVLKKKLKYSYLCVEAYV